MSSDQALELCTYASRLLGRSVSPGEHVTLSSGQLARLIAWAEAQGISLDPENGNRHRFLLATAKGEATPAHGSRAEHQQLSTPEQATWNGGALLPASIGIDLQLIAEVIPPFTDPKAVPELRGMFTLRELSYAECKPNPRETLAGLFAAKEAIKKADARYLDAHFQDIEVLPDADGKPAFGGMSISISHSGDYAVAAASCAATSPAASRTVQPAPATITAVTETTDRAPSRGPLRTAAYVVYHGILLCGALAFIALAFERVFGAPIF